MAEMSYILNALYLAIKCFLLGLAGLSFFFFLMLSLVKFLMEFSFLH